MLKRQTGPSIARLLRACGLTFAVVCISLLTAQNANALCSAPNAAIGSLDFQGGVFKYCDGTNWLNLGGTSFPLQGPNGSAGAPSYSFSNSTNSGLYLLGVGTLAFSTGGATRMVLDSSGELGIGTDNPSAPLHIYGSVGSAALEGKLVNTNSTGYGGWTSTNDANWNMWVGMSGSSQSAVPAYFSNNGYINSQGPNGLSIIAGGPNIKFFAGGTSLVDEKMRIVSAGSVGIGTTAPTAFVDIQGAGDPSYGHVVQAYTTSTLASIFQARAGPIYAQWMANNSNAAWNGLGGKHIGVSSASGYPFGISVNGSQNFTVTQAGNVLIGTGTMTSPGLRLDVTGGPIGAGPVAAGSGNGGQLRLFELAASGTNTVALRAPDALAANVLWTLPTTDGSANQALVTNGAGSLSWASGGGDFYKNGSATMTGQFKSVLGNSAAPGIAFAGDPNTGFYSSGADQVIFSANSTDSFIMDSSGIFSNTSGAYYLNNVAAASATPSYSFRADTNTGMYSPGSDAVAFATAGQQRLSIDSVGNVGIGLSNGAQGTSMIGNKTYLGITGDGSANPNANGVLVLSNNRATAAGGDVLGGVTWSSLNDTNAEKAGIYVQNSGSGGVQGYGAQLNFYVKQDNVASSPVVLQMTSDVINLAAGSIGIGTWSPGAKLGINHALSSGTVSSMRGIWNNVNTSGGATTTGLKGIENYLDHNANSDALLVTGDDVSVRNMSSYGSMNLAKAFGASVTAFAGTISSASGMHVSIDSSAGTITTGYGVRVQDIKAATAWAFYQDGASDDNYFAGDVGIGISNPGYKLHVVGTAGLSTGTAWTNASDARLKHVEGPYEYGLKEVLKLRPVRYHYKKGNALGLPSDHAMTGFIAQEVQTVIPDAVSVGSKDYLQLNVDPIHWATVNAVKQLHGMCVDNERSIASVREETREELAQAKDRIDSLEKQVELLKAYICAKDPQAGVCAH